MVDILDSDGRVIGSVSREEAERDNHTTPNVLIFLFDLSGKVWKQLRAGTKKHYPGMWDISACGGVETGEDPLDSAKRETAQEAGIDDVELIFVEEFLNVFPGDNGEERRRLSRLYIGVTDKTPVADGDEVAEFQSNYPDDIRLDIAENPTMYIPSFLIELDKAEEAYKKLAG